MYIFCIVEAVVQKMTQNNVFTIAKRNVEGQDMLYQSLKLTNGIWVLNELKIQPGNPNITVSIFFVIYCLVKFQMGDFQLRTIPYVRI